MIRHLITGAFLLTTAAYPSTGPAVQGLSFQSGPPGTPSASVRITQLSTKPSKHGFLRIATLPAVAASGVEIRVKNPSSNFLADVSEYIASLTKSQTFELQNVAIHVGDEKVPRLTAQTATVSKQKWDLKNVRIPSAEKNRLFPSASINTAVAPVHLVPKNSQPTQIQAILTATTP
jgi:hypothetical protein